MSYDIIRSYNRKEKTITYAPNNIWPRTYYTYTYKHKDGTLYSDEEYMLSLVKNALSGADHFSKNSKIEQIASVIRKDPAFIALDDMLWNFNRKYDRKFHNEAYENIEKVYNIYLKHKIKELDEGKVYFKVRAAIYSSYNDKYDVFVSMDNKVYIGLNKNYDNAGTYDNTDGSLFYCGEDGSGDKDLFYALSDKNYKCSDELKNKCIEIYAKLSTGVSL